MRLIDADALKEEVSKKKVVGRFNTLSLIDAAPTVIWCNETPDGLPLMDLRPRPKGEWIVDEDNDLFNFMKCSNCGEVAEWLDGGSQFLSNFCPNCGARMKGGAE